MNSINKKTWRILVAYVLLVTVLICAVACTNNADNTPMQQTPTPTDDSTVVDQTEDSKPTEKITDNSKWGKFKKTAEIEETVLVDENDVKVTATGISYDNSSFEISLLIENNSEEDLSFICGSLGYSCNSVNGFMIEDGYLNCDVSAGKKANDTIKFAYTSLQIYGINEVATIELGFDIHDDDYNSFYTGPRQIKTSIADGFEYDEKSYQKTVVSQPCIDSYGYTVNHFATDKIYSSNGVEIDSEGMIVNKDGDTALLIEIANSLSEQILVSIKGVMVNGLVICDSTWTGGRINSGTRYITEITLSDILEKGYWDLLGISEIGEVSFIMEVHNCDDEEVCDAERITVTIPGATASLDQSGTSVYSDNGIEIISKGITESESKYDNDLKVLFIVRNNGNKNVSIDDDYNSLSVNGFMCDYSLYSIDVNAGEMGILEITLDDSSLEKNSIKEIEDISRMEVKLEILDDDWDKIDEPTIIIEY